MNSATIFEARVRKYQKKSMKYIRYMLNDHFLIVLFFLFGFIMVQYSSWIQTIRVLEWLCAGMHFKRWMLVGFMRILAV